MCMCSAPCCLLCAGADDSYQLVVATQVADGVWQAGSAGEARVCWGPELGTDCYSICDDGWGADDADMFCRTVSVLHAC